MIVILKISYKRFECILELTTTYNGTTYDATKLQCKCETTSHKAKLEI